MRKWDYIYLLLFFYAVFEMYESFKGKASLESCIGITFLVLIVYGFVTIHLLKAFKFIIKYFG